MSENSKVMMFTGEFGAVRTILIGNDVYFVGKDIAEALGYVDTADAIRKHVDEEDKMGRQITDSLGRLENTIVINESGLYSLILGSQLPTAKKFKKWVTSEVLPEIRQTGGYIPSSEGDSDDDILAKALVIAQNKIEAKNKRLAEQDEVIQELAPKAEQYDSLMDSKERIDIKQLASILNLRDGKKVLGRNKLFEKLRKEEILTKYNEPYQRFLEAGYFKVIITKTGFTKTLVTPKGLEYLSKRLL